MRIAFIASECEPWAKTGGLGDVVDALARALGRITDGEILVDVFLPRYRSVVVPADAPGPVILSAPSVPPGAAVRTIRGDGYRLRLVEHAPSFDRDGFYGDARGDYPDNLARFTVLARVALATLDLDVEHGEPAVDVLHVHDWQGVPAILLRDLDGWGTTVRPATMLTIHNLAYHGWVDRPRLDQLGLDGPVTLRLGDAEGFDLLGAGIERADLVSTVSPTYAAEALTPEYGMGLEASLLARGDRFTGILNAIDPELWDPARDPAIAAAYLADDRSGKADCRTDLCRRLGLDASPDGGPIAGVVGRLDRQKGFDLVEGAARRLASEGFRLAILGAGDAHHIEGIRAIAAEVPGRVAVVDQFDRDLARRIYAGSDLFLMPSRFEPCGQGQMIALRYGTPPIVRRTGGLADTVVDVGRDPHNGTGFVFDDATPEALLGACRRAASLYRSPDRAPWAALVERAMRVDFSWESGPARRYVEAYQRSIRLRGDPASRPR